MAVAKILEHGQITIPKQIRESLGLKRGDIVDTWVEGDCVVITPKKSVTSEDWEKLLQVMDTVHDQNRDISEKEVYQDVQRAVTELRQEDYDQQKETVRRPWFGFRELSANPNRYSRTFYANSKLWEGT